MNVERPLLTERTSRWRRGLAMAIRRRQFMPYVEALTVLLLVAMLATSYVVLTGNEQELLLTPPLVALLLVANLVPAMALMVLVARRIAMRRAAKSPIGGRGRLHVRLVAFFSVIASVPTLLVVIFASLLFQSGLDFWFSERARAALASAEQVATGYRSDQMAGVQLEVQVMGNDVVRWANERGFDDPQFYDFMLNQTVRRNLIETALLTIGPEGDIQMQGGINLYDRPLEDRFSVATLRAMEAGETRVKEEGGDRVEAVVRLDPEAPVYVYGARAVNPDLLGLAEEAGMAAGDYKRVLARARSYQFRFNAALLIGSLLIVALACWVALALAYRQVRPVGELVAAARRVAAGDLSARVPAVRAEDEIGTLGNAFNRMTRRLEEQTGALVSANRQLDDRRSFIEAVLSGVTAGVISIDEQRRIRLINRSAAALLGTDSEKAVGKKLAALAPDLASQLDEEERESIIQLTAGGEARTLAVKRVPAEGGEVITFDDITDQLLDQRRAAWADVARRIAHEIKNPLTPIQLAAERLQRRYGSQLGEQEEGVFTQLTRTIVRQVGDLRRMVDEFSSFARMPKPVFHEESLVDIARQALFLHEVAHPEIDFVLDAPDPPPRLVCDRRQLGQALTNIVKNSVEAIGCKPGESERRIVLRIEERGERTVVEVADSGIGLPRERKRITEPYMTTRERGTGLGLAIVKKIIEEHFGTMEFADRPGGGTIVRLVFDAGALAGLGGAATRVSEVVKG
ncbi:MAG: ATP-binding protein [Sphingomonadaceae bacterium]